MPTFKPCIQKQRADGFYCVYIRLIHNRQSQFIKTDKIVARKSIAKDRSIKDAYVMRYCLDKITDYIDRLNRIDIESWSAKEVKDYLLSGSEDVCFSDYARKHHDKMVNSGHERNARNYELAYQHLERYAGTNKFMFSQMTSTFINRWIESLSETKRAKEMYPICIRQIYKAAILDYNDYDTGLIRIKTNPWVKVKIPAADTTQKLAITPEQCREFFSAPLPESKMKEPLEELSRDVAMMILCLAGINTIDLYQLKKSDYYDNIIHYNRAKTRSSRRDSAYIEMRVPPILHPIFDKYLDDDPSHENLFKFSQRHRTPDSFGANVNGGIKKICEYLNIPKQERYCCYTFRHTWGTIAQNDCGATLSEIAFAMNHASAHTVTRGYIKVDFAPAWELNEKVVNLVFFTTKASHRETEAEEDNALRLSAKYLVDGKMYYKGKLLYSVHDIGYNNKEEVIKALAEHLPDDIPMRSMIQFRIENVDKHQVAVYERMKGGRV